MVIFLLFHLVGSGLNPRRRNRVAHPATISLS
jgi:hypothetical protein